MKASPTTVNILQIEVQLRKNTSQKLNKTNTKSTNNFMLTTPT